MSEQHPDIVIRYIKTKGKTRKITTYRSDDCSLRNQHKRICEFIEKRFCPSKFTKGYVKKRSIYHNAYAHLYNDCFIMIDIKDFFPHICHKQLADKLYHEMNLTAPGQISKKECKYVVASCSTSSRGLPLGFITSPILSNVYMKEFDGIFYGKLKKMGLDNVIYTRYADDMTISFKSAAGVDLALIEISIVTLASELLSRYGLQVNKKKTRSYSLDVSNHVRVTGINITKKNDGSRRLTIGRSIKNELFWEAMECYEKRDSQKINHVKGLQSFILSIEKTGYESCYSEAMIERVRACGYSSLKQLIDSL